MLSHKAMLVSLNIRQWIGRKFDSEATGNVETTFATQGSVGRYSKRLLPEAKELRHVQTLASSMRAKFYEQTLPWYSDGSRIISAKYYLDFANQFRKLKTEYNDAVGDFLQAYPALKEAAKDKLGNLWNEADYPSILELERAFSCEIHFMPVPDVSDFRVEILEEEKQEFLNKMADVEHKAMNEVWHRLYDVVSKAAHRLADPSAVFRNTLIDNITEMCQLLPKLNVNDDPSLEDMRRQVEGLANSINLDACRVSGLERGIAAERLREATEKMSAFMGK